MEDKSVKVEYKGQIIVTTQACIDQFKDETGLDLIDEMKKAIDKENE